MERYHPMKDLAPRDVVARSIDHELKESGADCVFLDVTHLKADFLHDRFPNISARCLALGIDLTKEPVPVVPAAHYQCGGVVTDINGCTDIQNLYAVGEVAHSAVHGGNRLASNSLLEAVVFANAAASHAATLKHESKADQLPEWDDSKMRPSDETVVVSHTWDELRRFMWNYVGIVRSTARLERAQRRLALMRSEIRDYYWKFLVTPDLLELRNIYVVARLIVTSAMRRKESRGLHFMVDYPETDDATQLHETILTSPPEELL
jgi:L-aspartate oxidase